MTPRHRELLSPKSEGVHETGSTPAPTDPWQTIWDAPGIPGPTARRVRNTNLQPTSVPPPHLPVDKAPRFIPRGRPKAGEVLLGGCPSNVRRERGEADARAGAQKNSAES